MKTVYIVVIAVLLSILAQHFFYEGRIKELEQRDAESFVCHASALLILEENADIVFVGPNSHEARIERLEAKK